MKAGFIALCAFSSAVLAVAGGCSSDEGDDDGSAGAAAIGGDAGTGGSSGASASGGSSGSGKGGSSGNGGSSGGSSGKGGNGGSSGGTAGAGATGGSTGATGGSSGDAGAANGEAGSGSGADGGAAGGSGVELVGVCGHRGDSTVTADEFSGFEEYFLIGEEGFGDDICIVRFDVTRVGPAPEGCPDCLWSHVVERSNPTVVLDENGVCGSSGLELDAAGIAALDGSQMTYGFVPELLGHVSIALTLNEETNMWEEYNSATWDETTGRFRFDRRNGFCSY